MNEGLIASRYAHALLSFARETHEEAGVYEGARTILAAIRKEIDMTASIESAPEPLRKFVALVVHNNRVEYLAQMLLAYRKLYRQEYGITRAWLTTARENPGLAERLEKLMLTQGFTEIDFKTKVDPSLIGGFIVQVEDKRVDASIASQLKHVKRELENKIRKNRNNG